MSTDAAIIGSGMTGIENHAIAGFVWCIRFQLGENNENPSHSLHIQYGSSLLEKMKKLILKVLQHPRTQEFRSCLFKTVPKTVPVQWFPTLHYLCYEDCHKVQMTHSFEINLLQTCISRQGQPLPCHGLLASSSPRPPIDKIGVGLGRYQTEGM